jgi:seryl-tRNA synthetase
MLDIKYIVENTDAVRRSIKERHVKCDIDEVIRLYEVQKLLKTDIENLRAAANQNASAMKDAKSQDERVPLIAKGGQIKADIQALTDKVTAAEVSFHQAMMTVPNALADDVPSGQDDNENVTISHFMEPTKFDFTPKDHLELGADLDLIDFEAGAKVTGSKFYFLKNEAVLLEMAIKNLAMRMAMQKGYLPMITPDLARNDVLEGIGFNPRGEESNTYMLEGLDLSLIATAEIAAGGYHRDEIIDTSKLPIKYVADSHCFRREAGSGGQSSKGMYRVHQFSKIELFVFCTPEQSAQVHEEIRELEESIYQALKIPYRVMNICAGDLGAAAYKKYDIEAWMPGKDDGGAYGEVTSASNCLSFQARRLNIRHKNPETGKNEFVHTLNGTAAALSRTPIAILENYQTKEGDVIIPEVLRAFMGIDKITKDKSVLRNLG